MEEEMDLYALETLMDIYVYEKRLAECSYELMGLMLNANVVKKGIDWLDTQSIYIYGGGYLGLQFYRAASGLIHIPAIVDRKEKLAYHIPEISVISNQHLRKVYHGEKIVVASIQYYDEIKKELSFFVSSSHIIYLGEVLGGSM